MKARLDDRERAQFGPIDLKQTGSVEWCWQVIELLKDWVKREEWAEEQFDLVLRKIKEQRVWEKIPPNKPYGSLEALLEAEIGQTEKRIRERCQQLAQEAVPLAEHGEIGRGRENRDYNVMSTQGNHTDYLTRRIARDYPAILERMKAGEYKSVRQAALEVGIVKPQITVPLEPEAAARALKRHFDKQQLEVLIDILTQ